MSFYGYNQSAQCGWMNLMWQELGVGPTSEFFANLTTALAEAVSARAECGARSLVELPRELWVGRKHLAPGWQGVLEEYKARISPFIANETIVGIFMGDELAISIENRPLLEDCSSLSDFINANIRWKICP